MKAPRDKSGDVCGKKSISNSKFYQAPQQFFLLYFNAYNYLLFSDSMSATPAISPFSWLEATPTLR
jgi:hypothetical protein